jgi:ADP-ribosylation factor-like protein 2
VWDVGGQSTIRSYWRNYYEQTDGLVFVIDSADVRRMEMCKAELHQLLKQEKLAGASLLIFANKQDLAGALTQEQIAAVLDLPALGETTNRHWRIVGCSAWNGKGLIDGVDWIVRDIAGRIYMME